GELREQDEGAGGGPGAAARAGALRLLSASREAVLVRLAGALLLAGVGLVNVAEADWAHVAGAVAFVGAIAAGTVALAPGAAAGEPGASATGPHH
ncbi:MAG: hypothetical protein JWM31_3503, partial [Solirubrobacterales bacterium]|nr:hypothetical protein [Solirubrobacterales bacterium]